MRCARIAALVGLGTIAWVGSASAVQMPAHLAGRPALEVASGAPVRQERVLDWQHAPRAAARSWARFASEVGPGWRAAWDPATRVPSRLYGPGLAAPGAVASEKQAATFSRAFLARHIELLAPGASPADFVLVSNQLDGGMRTVGFLQHAGGLRVLGGQVSFRFKNDRLFMVGSEAMPRALATTQAPAISEGLARAAAEQWVLSDSAASAKAGAVEGPFVLPLIAQGGVRYHTVVRAIVEAEAPVGRWSVYLDALTAAPVAREQTLHFAQGTVFFNAPVRWPGALRADYPALLVEHTIDGAPVLADAAGVVTFPDGGPVSLLVQAEGSQVRVFHDTGTEATITLPLDPGGTAVWNAQDEPLVDAQLASYIHAHEAKAYTKGIAPSMAFVDQKLNVTVNINDTCNAFSDGTSINFYKSGNGCENTGRLADVVYHEFGHSFHAHAIIDGVGDFDGALSEGVSDYLAATMTGDPAMGRGFFFDNQPLRHIDPPNDEQVWPDDIGEVHFTGLIIGGALWDLRKALVAKLGEVLGVAQSDKLYYEGIRRAVDIPTMYPEVLAADDDDGDVTNGTPNACEISAAFAAHGLRSLTAEVPSLGAEPPSQEGYKVSLTISGLFAQCGGDTIGSAKVEWRLREDQTVGSTLNMVGSGSAFEAVIPPQPDGSVVQYRVLLKLSNGASIAYPDNPADPRYEFFVGKVEPIYCTDFEADPGSTGWTHGLTSGETSEGADDWQWGVPEGTAGSGDPTDAFSGNRVFGNDLGGGNFNGNYQSDKVNFALSPSIDVTPYKSVRLQYRRWLNVEDAFFDRATIYANETPAWVNLNSDQGDGSNVHHQDKEWRFHDVDLSAHAPSGAVQIKYEIASDGGLELGGWTLDDFCVVGHVPTIPAEPVCGDGFVDPGEACDDGAGNSDAAPDACRSDCGPAACGDGIVDTGEACDDGNLADGDACSAACATVTVPPPGPKDAAGGDAGNDDGCGCRTAGGRPRHAAAGLFALALALAAARRRRRS